MYKTKIYFRNILSYKCPLYILLRWSLWQKQAVFQTAFSLRCTSPSAQQTSNDDDDEYIQTLRDDYVNTHGFVSKYMRRCVLMQLLRWQCQRLFSHCTRIRIVYTPIYIISVFMRMCTYIHVYTCYMYRAKVYCFVYILKRYIWCMHYCLPIVHIIFITCRCSVLHKTPHIHIVYISYMRIGTLHCFIFWLSGSQTAHFLQIKFHPV